MQTEKTAQALNVDPPTAASWNIRFTHAAKPRSYKELREERARKGYSNIGKSVAMQSLHNIMIVDSQISLGIVVEIAVFDSSLIALQKIHQGTLPVKRAAHNAANDL